MEKKCRIAVLIHLLSWNSNKKKYNLVSGISFQKLQNHPVEKLYHKECYENKIDFGEPYLFDSCIIIDDWEAFFSSVATQKDPYSILARLLNILAINFQTTIDFVRVFISEDNFKSHSETYEIDYFGAQSEFLLKTEFEINDNSFKKIKKMWNNVSEIWKNKKSKSRIINALTHLYYSWNVHYVEQTAIYISIVLENIFSPHSKDELSHQIAFNSCQFLCDSREDKKAKYKQIKKYYSVRSKIVHGEIVSDNDEAIIPEFFQTVCSLLGKIISNKRLIEIFDNNEKRKEYLEDLIF